MIFLLLTVSALPLRRPSFEARAYLDSLHKSSFEGCQLLWGWWFYDHGVSRQLIDGSLMWPVEAVRAIRLPKDVTRPASGSSECLYECQDLSPPSQVELAVQRRGKRAHGGYIVHCDDSERLVIQSVPSKRHDEHANRLEEQCFCESVDVAQHEDWTSTGTLRHELSDEIALPQSRDWEFID